MILHKIELVLVGLVNWIESKIKRLLTGYGPMLLLDFFFGMTVLEMISFLQDLRSQFHDSINRKIRVLEKIGTRRDGHSVKSNTNKAVEFSRSDWVAFHLHVQVQECVCYELLMPSHLVHFNQKSDIRLTSFLLNVVV